MKCLTRCSNFDFYNDIIKENPHNISIILLKKGRILKKYQKSPETLVQKRHISKIKN